jgi:hypothetical protein
MTSTAAARHEAVPLRQFQREVIGELVRCGRQLGKAGVNLDQAVTKLNATGTPTTDYRPDTGRALRCDDTDGAGRLHAVRRVQDHAHGGQA